MRYKHEAFYDELVDLLAKGRIICDGRCDYCVGTVGLPHAKSCRTLRIKKIIKIIKES